MIRSSRIKIMDLNDGKLKSLDRFMTETTRVINLYIDRLWQIGLFNSKFIDFSVDGGTWLSTRMQQCAGKQALEIVKSQRKKKKKTKPIFTKSSINLDSRFTDIRMNQNGFFDTWIKFSSLGDKTILKVPSLLAKHTHLNKFLLDGWEPAKSIRLLKRNGEYYIDLILKKDNPTPVTIGKTIGFDCGYKKLLVDSEGQIHDTGLEIIYNKISRKKRGSKSFTRSLKERDNAVNRTVNSINLDNIKIVKVENLKNVKSFSKGKLSKKFNNKLQRWTYPKVLDRIQSRCEILGISFYTVNPAYTSQTCSCCGTVDANSRKGESFTCTACGMKLDADVNASINISRTTGVIASVP